jgi:hypothetical protein
MRKIALYAGLVVATLGFSSVATTTSFAAGCIAGGDAPPISLSHNDMVPGAGFGYNKDAYTDALAQGNLCPTVRQAEHTPRNGTESMPNVSKGPQTDNSVIN